MQQSRAQERRRPLPLLVLLLTALCSVGCAFLIPPTRPRLASAAGSRRSAPVVASRLIEAATTAAVAAEPAAGREGGSIGSGGGVAAPQEKPKGARRLLFKGLQSERFRHPLDQQATEQLRLLPGLEWIVRRFMRVVEEAVYLVSAHTDGVENWIHVTARSPHVIPSLVPPPTPTGTGQHLERHPGGPAADAGAARLAPRGLPHSGPGRGAGAIRSAKSRAQRLLHGHPGPPPLHRRAHLPPRPPDARGGEKRTEPGKCVYVCVWWTERNALDVPIEVGSALPPIPPSTGSTAASGGGARAGAHQVRARRLDHGRQRPSARAVLHRRRARPDAGGQNTG